MRNIILSIALLLTVVSCGTEPKLIISSGTIEFLQCKDIWRSSDMLSMRVKDSKTGFIHKFNNNLQLVRCEKALKLLKVGQSIQFHYENAGYKDTGLAKLIVDGTVIVDEYAFMRN